MKLPQYASGVPDHLLVRFTCRRACGMRRFGRVSKRDWPFFGLSSDPDLSVSCLVCGGVQRDCQNWDRVFPYEPEVTRRAAPATSNPRASVVEQDRQPAACLTGVWCTRCRSNFAANADVIRLHYRLAHHHEPSEKLLAHVLGNTYSEAKWHAKRKYAVAGSSASAELDHEKRWSGVIQGGAPGSGKRR